MPDDRPRTPVEAEEFPSAGEEVVSAPGAPAQLRQGIPWRHAWQVPVLLASIGLIAAGLWSFQANVQQDDPAHLVMTGNALVEAGRDQEALVLFARADELIDDSDPELRAQLLVALADFEARRALADREDHRILERYDQAQAFGHELAPEQVARRASALAALGRFDAAFEELSGALGDASQEGVRVRILRRLVERAEQGDAPLRARLTEVLDRYAAQQGRDFAYAAWAVLASAQLRLGDGQAQEGVDVMMRAMRRLDLEAMPTAPINWGGRLYATLGRLWLDAGDRDAARGPLEIALRELGPSDEYRRRAEASIAWIDFANGDHDSAIMRFDEIVAASPDQSTLLEVRLWRAEAHAALDQHEQAAEDYRFLLGHPATGTAPFSKRIVESIGDRVRESVVRSSPERAIMFAELALQSAVFKFDQEMVSHAAGAHRALAESILRGHSDEPDLMAISLEDVPEESRREATAHFREAGALYLSLATRLLPEPMEREGWMYAQYSAAECFDLGADSTRAIQAYVRYLDATTPKDLQRARIAFRHARALHSAGRYSEALDAYDDLVDRHAGGPYAAKGKVYAARCLVALDRLQDARARLDSIVSGGPGGLRPEAVDYREAKYVLGRLLSKMKDWSAAITTLDEVIRRYPADERVPEAAFMLASAHQELAEQIALQIDDDAVTPSRRIALVSNREVHLQEASAAFELVVAAYDAHAPDSLEPVEMDMHRDAALGLADCTFELALYEQAVPLYEALERRYRDEPTSLEAAIRLVEIWDRLGRPEMAERAHRRAEIRLSKLPESAFEFPASRFDRDAWRIWLERRPLRSVHATADE